MDSMPSMNWKVEGEAERLFLIPHSYILIFFPRLFFLKLKQVVNDCQRIVLELGVQFIKKADYPFPLFHGGALKHLSLSAFEPCFIHPECEPDKPDDAVIGFSVPVFNFRRIAAADTDSPRKVHLGHFKDQPDLPDPLADRHIGTIPAFSILSKDFFYYGRS